ncbi:MAG: hypothetical protein ABIK43_00840 [candidate division WOR-3 bacterium]
MGTLVLTVGLVALVRLLDAVGKKELLGVVRELSVEAALLKGRHDSLAAERNRLELDRQVLEHRLAVLSRRENYLTIRRSQRCVRVGIEDKVLLEAPMQVRGPQDAVDAFMTMPRTTYQVLAKRDETEWVRPDWLYRLEGVQPPLDSAARIVRNAMGPAVLYLGGGLAIHGQPSEEVPSEAIDYVFVQLDTASLKAVVSLLQPGSLVFVE